MIISGNNGGKLALNYHHYISSFNVNTAGNMISFLSLAMTLNAGHFIAIQLINIPLKVDVAPYYLESNLFGTYSTTAYGGTPDFNKEMLIGTYLSDISYTPPNLNGNIHTITIDRP